MAVTQYHAIKSTVEKAIHYIVNPDKTDGQILVSSFMCSDDEQAAEDFAIVRQLGTRNGSVLAQHLIQSFLPDETTPEQAHEIGVKLAERFLKGHYQYVLATHVDKHHIHNHLIFNNVSFDNYRTFNMNENRGKHAWKVLQQISDQICREQELYVIPNPEQRKGKGWYEWQHDQQGSSWKKQLKHGIDEAIMASSSLSDFWEECRKRNIEFQYRPDRRISLKFRLTDAGQEKWTRARTLGWYYEPEQIEKRIANYAAFVRGEINYAPKTKIIDTTQERFAEAPGLERWAMLRNMQEASRMINFLTERGLTSPDDLNDRAVHEFDRRMKLVADLNEIQKKLDRVTDDISLIKRYRRLRPVYEASFTAAFRKKYAADHAAELQEYDTTEKQMQARFPDHSVPKIERLEQEKARLTEQRKQLNEEYKGCKAEIAELEKARETIAEYLKQAEPNRTKDTLE